MIWWLYNMTSCLTSRIDTPPPLSLLCNFERKIPISSHFCLGNQEREGTRSPFCSLNTFSLFQWKIEKSYSGKKSWNNPSKKKNYGIKLSLFTKSLRKQSWFRNSPINLTTKKCKAKRSNPVFFLCLQFLLGSICIKTRYPFISKILGDVTMELLNNKW